MFRGVATRLSGSQADEPEATSEGRLLTMLVGLIHFVVLVGCYRVSVSCIIVRSRLYGHICM